MDTQVDNGTRLRGVAYALGAAALFGASTPLAKQLLPSVQPILMAGIALPRLRPPVSRPTG